MDESNIIPAEDDSRIFFFEIEGLGYNSNKAFIDESLYDMIKSMMPDSLREKISFDNNGMYLSGKHMIQPQMITQETITPDSVYLLHKHEDINSDALDEIVLQSAQELNRNLIIASSSRYVQEMMVFMNANHEDITKEDINHLVEKFYQTYKHIYERN